MKNELFEITRKFKGIDQFYNIDKTLFKQLVGFQDEFTGFMNKYGELSKDELHLREEIKQEGRKIQNKYKDFLNTSNVELILGGSILNSTNWVMSKKTIRENKLEELLCL